MYYTPNDILRSFEGPIFQERLEKAQKEFDKAMKEAKMNLEWAKNELEALQKANKKDFKASYCLSEDSDA